MSNITAGTKFDSLQFEQLKRFLDIFAADVVDVVNGKLDFNTNFNGRLISITFTSANTNTSVAHGLSRTPSGYIITRLSASMIVYDGTLPNSSTMLTLKSSAAGTANILVF